MIKYLKNLGLSKEDINIILETNDNIQNEDLGNANKNVQTLKYFQCDNNDIKHIITSNPFYLSIPNDDILELICYLKKIGLNDFRILFTENPYVLNQKGYEMQKFIKHMINNFYSTQDICNEIYQNPYIFNEIYN